MPTDSLTCRIDIDATAAQVFAALTSETAICTYYPIDAVEADWQVGGTLRMHGVAADQPFTDHGVIAELIPNQRLRYSYWSTNHGTTRCAEHAVDLCYEVRPDPDKPSSACVLTVSQANFPHDALRSIMQTTWPSLLAALKNWVETQVST